MTYCRMNWNSWIFVLCGNMLFELRNAGEQLTGKMVGPWKGFDLDGLFSKWLYQKRRFRRCDETWLRGETWERVMTILITRAWLWASIAWAPNQWPVLINAELYRGTCTTDLDVKALVEWLLRYWDNVVCNGLCHFVTLCSVAFSFALRNRQSEWNDRNGNFFETWIYSLCNKIRIFLN